MDLASPRGGEVMFDIHSAPRTPDGAYVDDLISLGFANHAKYSKSLKNTLAISDIAVDDYDAVWVAGGGGPLLTFKDDAVLHQLIAAFYEGGKIVTLICHGSALLLWTRLSTGRLLAEGKKWTGFTDAEEDDVNTAFGMTLNEYTIQSEAAGMEGTSFFCRQANELFAIRNGRLITWQQRNHGGTGFGSARRILTTQGNRHAHADGHRGRRDLVGRVSLVRKTLGPRRGRIGLG